MPVFRIAPSASRLLRLVVAAALVAALPLMVDTRLVPPALAANFVVNLAADPGDGTCDASCTLRDAILNANALAGADSITFSAAITTPIVLASTLPTIAQDLTIDGSGQNITVDGANAFRVFFATAPLTLTALTVQRGRGPNDGFGGGGAYFGSTGTLSAVNFISNTSIAAGGAYFAGSVSISGGSFISNTATGASGSGGGAYVGAAAVISGTAFMTNTAAIGNGGGLYVFGTSALTNTTFISNTAAADGGGVYAFGAASVAGSTFERNRAASIFSSSGGGVAFTAGGSLANSSFISNTAVLNGGGVNSYGALAVSGSTFTGNSAGSGGGAYLAAAGTLTSTTFISNTALADGGGLWLGAATAATAQATDDDIAPITGATFTGNTAMAGSGGGAYLSGPSAISGSTFTGNSAAAQGGGVQAIDATTVTTSDFTSNTAGSGGGGAFGPATVSGSTFMSNTTTAGEGGGAKFRDVSLISASSFIGNLAIGHGGGLWSITTLSITTIYVYNNQTVASGLGVSHGGGAYLFGGGTVTDSTFDTNTAQHGNGGGLFGSGLTLTDLVVSGNQALCDDEQRLRASPQAVHDELCGNGGGAYVSGSGLWENGLFIGNQADGDGGGAYLSGAALVNFDLATFRQNVAGEEGGGAYVNGISGDWGRIQFSDNEAGADGGALYLDQSHLDVDNALWSTNRTLDPNGATDIGMSLNNTTLDAEHVTYVSPSVAGFQLSVSVGTDLPDEHGQQDPVATIRNALFHGYDLAVQGKAPTSTISLAGVLWSSVNSTVDTGNFQINVQYTGDAGFVNEAGGDYHLGAVSAALDRGLPTGLTVDLDGSLRNVGPAPDLGAYERQTAQPLPFDLFFPITIKF